jgi:hypothetical protein
MKEQQDPTSFRVILIPGSLIDPEIPVELIFDVQANLLRVIKKHELHSFGVIDLTSIVIQTFTNKIIYSSHEWNLFTDDCLEKVLGSKQTSRNPEPSRT